METEFPYVAVPKELHPVLGKPDPGTRVYRKDGSQEESAAWFDLLTELIGPSVSPGGVGMYCPVSRAAVYKRIKEGKLSMFLFHVTHRETSLFGKPVVVRELPYGYIPVSEVRAWREELERRAVSEGRITREELEGARPDWHGDFLQWREEEDQPRNLLEALRAEGIPLGDFVKQLAKGIFLPTLKKSTTKGGRPR